MKSPNEVWLVTVSSPEHDHEVVGLTTGFFETALMVGNHRRANFVGTEPCFADFAEDGVFNAVFTRDGVPACAYYCTQVMGTHPYDLSDAEADELLDKGEALAAMAQGKSHIDPTRFHRVNREAAVQLPLSERTPDDDFEGWQDAFGVFHTVGF